MGCGQAGVITSSSGVFEIKNTMGNWNYDWK